MRSKQIRALTSTSAIATPEFSWFGTLMVADTQWALIAFPATGVILFPQAAAWIAFIAGILLTSVLTSYWWSSARHTLNLHDLARRDPITALANRRAFTDRLSDAYATARRTGATFAVLYFDLDHFKDVNDTLGHAAGDTLLRIVAERIKQLVRRTDFIARFGGDEFAILLEADDEITTRILADRIVDTLSSPYIIGGNQVRVTASVGISYYSPESSGPEAMMIQADLALYRAKGDGRNCARFHTSDLDLMVRERVTIADNLHIALARKEFELHYQPQFELASGRIIGLEALIRWNHPTRGLVLPSVFIPIAETTGIIVELGRWVFEEACRQTKLWNDEGIAPQVVGVNFSAVECKRSEIVGEIRECLEKWKIKPQQMELELTESVLMGAACGSGRIVERLRKLGLRVAIDDFGTGYSSLSYLTSYPVDRLKVAQELVFGITTDERNASVVKIAIRLGRDLGIEVIAEGVETQAQVRFLEDAGCKWAQGFYFSKPVTAARATELLREASLELVSTRA